MMPDDALDLADSIPDQAAPDTAATSRDDTDAANIPAHPAAIAGSETGATVADDQAWHSEFSDAESDESDRSGILRLYNFERDVDRKMEAYRRHGKDPLDFLNPSKPDYLGAPEALLPQFWSGGGRGRSAIPCGTSCRAGRIIRCSGTTDGRGAYSNSGTC